MQEINLFISWFMYPMDINYTDVFFTIFKETSADVVSQSVLTKRSLMKCPLLAVVYLPGLAFNRVEGYLIIVTAPSIFILVR